MSPSQRLLAAASVGGLLLAVAAQPAAATPTNNSQCRLVATPLPSTWSISGYDPFSSPEPAGTFSVQYQNQGNGACNVTLKVRTENEPYGLRNAHGQILDYTLIDVTHTLGLTPDQGEQSAGSTKVQLNPGKLTVVQYGFAVDVNNLPADGLYQQHIYFDAQGVYNNQSFFSPGVTLQLQVLPSATISLLGAYRRGPGGTANIDLGDLQPGTALTRLSLLLQSTRGYKVEASSRNNGRLVLRDDANWSIPYQMTIGSNVMNLAGPASFTVPSPTLALQDTQPVGFVIGSTDRRRAGDYSDIITVSIAPF